MTEPLIEARGLSAGYGTMAVVRGVDPAWLHDGNVREELVRHPDEDLFH